MYLHCKHGFVEADRWDGNPVGLPEHAAMIAAISNAGHAVIVVRSRRRDTLHSLVGDMPRYKAQGILPRIVVLASPPGWDYEFRCYLSAAEWGMVLVRVAMGLDYRNFKSWTSLRAPQEGQLAIDIWHAAHDAVRHNCG